MNIDEFNIITKIRKWKSGKVRYSDMCRRLGWTKAQLVSTMMEHNLFKSRNHMWWDTEDRIPRLRDMAAKEMAASEIARDLGTTKNAVIGKARRLGVQLKQQPRSDSQVNKRRRARRVLALGMPKASPIRQHPFRPTTFTGPEIKDLPPEPHSDNWQEFRYVTGCRWPTLGEPGPEMMCCGAKQIEGQSYCEYHYWKSYRVPAKGFDPVKSFRFHTPATVLIDPDAA